MLSHPSLEKSEGWGTRIWREAKMKSTGAPPAKNQTGGESELQPLIDEIRNDVKSDIAALKKMDMPWWYIPFTLICGGGGYWFFDSVGREYLYLPTMNCILVFVFIIVLKWRLKRHGWFWTILTILAAIHVLLLLFIPWTEKWVPALGIAVIDTVDLIMIMAVFSFLDRLQEGT